MIDDSSKFNKQIRIIIIFRIIILFIGFLTLLIEFVNSGIDGVVWALLCFVFAFYMVSNQDRIGNFTGWTVSRVGIAYVDKKSPPSLIALFGWIIFLLPILTFVYNYLKHL